MNTIERKPLHMRDRLASRPLLGCVLAASLVCASNPSYANRWRSFTSQPAPEPFSYTRSLTAQQQADAEERIAAAIADCEGRYAANASVCGRNQDTSLFRSPRENPTYISRFTQHFAGADFDGDGFYQGGNVTANYALREEWISSDEYARYVREREEEKRGVLAGLLGTSVCGRTAEPTARGIGSCIAVLAFGTALDTFQVTDNPTVERIWFAAQGALAFNSIVRLAAVASGPLSFALLTYVGAVIAVTEFVFKAHAMYQASSQSQSINGIDFRTIDSFSYTPIVVSDTPDASLNAFMTGVLQELQGLEAASRNYVAAQQRFTAASAAGDSEWMDMQLEQLGLARTDYAQRASNVGHWISSIPDLFDALDVDDPGFDSQSAQSELERIASGGFSSDESQFLDEAGLLPDDVSRWTSQIVPTTEQEEDTPLIIGIEIIGDGIVDETLPRPNIPTFGDVSSGLSLQILAAALRDADAPINYRHDSGVGASAIGCGFVGAEISWVNHFNRDSDSPVYLSRFQFAMGRDGDTTASVLNPTSLNFVIYDDPNGDGDPADASLLGRAPSIAFSQVGNDQFNEWPLPPELLFLPPSFFVGLEYTILDLTEVLPRFDNTPATGIDKSWIRADECTSGAWAPLSDFTNGFFMLRAQGAR